MLKGALTSKANENYVEALKINRHPSNLKHKEPQRIRKMREYFVAQEERGKIDKAAVRKMPFLCTHTENMNNVRINIHTPLRSIIPICALILSLR